MTIPLFIDTNVYLSFFSYSEDDLEQLKKLPAAIKDNHVRLYATWNVVNEFVRNRENRLATALRDLRKAQVEASFPMPLYSYNEYAELQQSMTQFYTRRDALIEAFTADAVGFTLQADIIVKSIFDLAHTLSSTKEFIERAQLRSAVGDPPGKKNSIGDALNWELLIDHVETENENPPFCLVSGDSDYESPIEKGKILPFLSGEWKQRKESEIILYTSLGKFFEDHFPDIKIASEMERKLLIDKGNCTDNVPRLYR